MLPLPSRDQPIAFDWITAGNVGPHGAASAWTLGVKQYCNYTMFLGAKELEISISFSKGQLKSPGIPKTIGQLGDILDTALPRENPYFRVYGKTGEVKVLGHALLFSLDVAALGRWHGNLT